MANQKTILQFDKLTSAANGDAFVLVDISDPTHDASGTTKYITKANLFAGLAASGDNTDINSLLLDQSGLFIKGDDDNALKIKCHELLTSTRTLRLVVNDATRIVDLGGNLTVPSSATVSGTNTGDETHEREVPFGARNSVNTSFTLGNIPASKTLSLYLNGLLQTEYNDFTISGTTITMLVAPNSDDELIATYNY